MARVLVVANRTAATPDLLEAVRERAGAGDDPNFHLLVPAQVHGLHRLVDAEDVPTDEAEETLAKALPGLREAAGGEVDGSVGDPDPLTAIQDYVNVVGADEIIVSTLPGRVSRWLRLDLVSKARGLGLPVTHVEAQETADV
jgi:hypothetical protein